VEEQSEHVRVQVIVLVRPRHLARVRSDGHARSFRAWLTAAAALAMLDRLKTTSLHPQQH
jgi:hypothetical protein